MSRTLAVVSVMVVILVGAAVTLLRLTGRETLAPAGPLSPDPAPVRGFEVVAEYPHDPEALTQGLVYSGGYLYESIGMPGRSAVRKVELETGRVVREQLLRRRLLGAGLAEWGGQLVQLTPAREKQSGIHAWLLDNLKTMGAPFVDQDSGVRYDAGSLAPQSTFGYNIDGWGLTQDGRKFIKSDGTSILRFLDPKTMEWQAQIGVVEAGKGVRWLNELEYVDGQVYANLWQQDRIAIIQLDSGQVTGWIDLAPLRRRMAPAPRDVEELGAYGKAVANGIAYDAAGGRLLVTGKRWPRVFAIRVR